MGSARSALQKAELYFNQFQAIPRLDESESSGQLLDATKKVIKTFVAHYVS